MCRLPRKLVDVVALVLILVVSGVPRAVDARSRAEVEWSQVHASTTIKDGEKLAKTLRLLLKDASRKADFGEAGKVLLRARLTEYVVEKKGDVLRIRCTVVGRLDGGPSAKSHIVFGGDPKDPKSLEQQVLKMVAHGVTSRLAALAKARSAKKIERTQVDSLRHSPTAAN